MVSQSRYIDNKHLVCKGSRIMKFAHHSKLQVHDLYLFVGGKLSDACKNWGVPAEFSKTDFDHSKVYDMASALKHEDEVKEYLKYDVVSLAHLFKIYHTTMWKCFSVDMSTFAFALSFFANAQISVSRPLNSP